jgi:hypothetical protein
MTPRISRAVLLAAVLLIAAALLVSCGREAPVQQPGMIAVHSDPAGATIFLDGVDQGLVTPDTLVNLDPGTYEVSVELDGYQSQPLSQTATVTPLTVAPLPEFTLSQTSLLVTSSPEGASVFLNGIDTELTTPALLVGLDAGTAEISLQLPGYLVSPASFLATVVEGEANEVPGNTFSLRPVHTVLLEGLSNVNCAGCPEMADNVHDFMHRPGFGLDRVLYIKYSMQYPWIGDPLYQHNTAENDARMFYYQDYQLGGIPVLIMEGAQIFGTSNNETPTTDEIQAQVSPLLTGDPGFLVDVTADFTGTNVPVAVTLTAHADVTLADKNLVVVLVQTLIEFEEAPGSEGETEFHNIFRDRADSVDALVNLSEGQNQTINTTVLRDGSWNVDDLLVIAFVQDDSDKTIHQAGSSALTDAAPGHKFFTAAGSGMVRPNPINTGGLNP